MGKGRRRGKKRELGPPIYLGVASSLLPLNVGGRKRPRGKERKREDKEWNRLFGLLNEEKELCGKPGANRILKHGIFESIPKLQIADLWFHGNTMDHSFSSLRIPVGPTYVLSRVVQSRRKRTKHLHFPHPKKRAPRKINPCKRGCFGRVGFVMGGRGGMGKGKEETESLLFPHLNLKECFIHIF